MEIIVPGDAALGPGKEWQGMRKGGGKVDMAKLSRALWGVYILINGVYR